MARRFRAETLLNPQGRRGKPREHRLLNQKEDTKVKHTDYAKPDKQLFHEFLIDPSLSGFNAQVSFMETYDGVPHLKAQKRVKKDFMR